MFTEMSRPRLESKNETARTNDLGRKGEATQSSQGTHWVPARQNDRLVSVNDLDVLVVR